MKCIKIDESSRYANWTNHTQMKFTERLVNGQQAIGHELRAAKEQGILFARKILFAYLWRVDTVSSPQRIDTNPTC